MAAQHSVRFLVGGSVSFSFSKLCLLFTLLALAASGVSAQAPLSAVDAVEAVKSSASKRVAGVFEFKVAGVGRDGNFWYLNSEQDYRSPTCLSVAIRRSLWSSVREIAGGDIENLVGRTVRIEGTAERIRAHIRPEVRDTKRRWYYQTHVSLTKASHLTVGDET